MKKYSFLFKPLLFIFNLFFATWLVFKIEKIRPSDFGRYGYLFEDVPPPSMVHQLNKQYIKKLCLDYKAGMIDSVALEEKIEKILLKPSQLSETQQPADAQ